MFSTKCENYMYSADYISLTVWRVDDVKISTTKLNGVLPK